MRIKRIGVAAVALAAASALTLAGCSSDSPAPSAGGDTGAIITTNGTEPQNPLIPTNTNEVGGGKIIDQIFAGLIYYDADGKPINDVAESIESEDNQHFTIKIKPDLEFTNGDPVDAASFVDAWNYGAALDNAHLSSYFFEDIEGFSWDENVEEMSGLEVVDDTTFTVALKQPTADFALRLGYSAFYPLPASAWDDIEAFGQNPIGNGPYMLDGEGAWKHNEKISLVVNPDYDGGRKAANGGLDIIFYASQEASYSDLEGGNLDVVDEIPSSAVESYEDTFGERAVNQASALFQSFTVPDRLAHFAGEEGKLRRAAISMAIDREEITEVIFGGTRTPASDFTSPIIAGWTDELEGEEVLEFNPEEAKKLWAEADAISPWEGSFQIAYNADGDHQDWVDAVSNQLKNNLGIEASGVPSPTFKEVRETITNRTIQTAFRSGWQADYPGLFNYLGPLYGTNAGSNDGDYSNPEVDKLLKEGQSTSDADEQNAKFQAAQEILLKDLPAIPLWYQNVNGAWSEQVENVEYGWNSVPLYFQVTKAE
ncbi:peptide ABC transporter substrate-binding protein [Agromyces archimandritae]|uniref:ABC transporter substrate-binding protein n=1 Tax=Agromyces archimandritae TaxID=2781962 RepID=A0A975FKL2_9MICO|nr:ABC transporter substrate-binding protein [Agromyces archimandritae]QTX04248.1 ABC transporter substrate-binding protein [Agromyces archimandritae]